MATYYDILELKDTASVEVSDVKRAFRKLALVHHPDKKGGDEIKFKEISEAYDVLIDPLKRRNYDQKLQRGVSKSLSPGTSKDVVERRLAKDLKLKQPATGRYVVVYQGVMVRTFPEREAPIHPKELLLRGDFFEIQGI